MGYQRIASRSRFIVGVSHNEQGFGDTIQFARFVPMVAARGGKVILACQQTVVELMQSVPGIHRVIGQTKGKQKVPRFDVMGRFCICG